MRGIFISNCLADSVETRKYEDVCMHVQEEYHVVAYPIFVFSGNYRGGFKFRNNDFFAKMILIV